MCLGGAGLVLGKEREAFFLIIFLAGLIVMHGGLLSDVFGIRKSGNYNTSMNTCPLSVLF